ncbi:MAG: metallophosphoesterase family protein [Pseudomonadota bacterium]
MKALRRLLGRTSATGAEDPPMPDRLTYAVGDIHGCLDQLEQMLDEIERDAVGTPYHIVFLGDYVDRGPQSAGVLRLLHALDTAAPPEAGSQAAPAGVTCLLGNHDFMMLDFIAEPEDGVNWLLVGGGETLMSFGIPHAGFLGTRGGELAQRVAAQAAALAEAMGDDLIDWLANRPLWWQSGDLVAVHALTEPEKPMQEQSDATLLWARPARNLAARGDGTWVVHGHTIVSEPTVRARHVNVDTGAFRGGPLTAAVFAPGEAVRFLPVHKAGDGLP